MDAPGFYGAEISLLRVMEMVGTDDTAVVRGGPIAPELERFFRERCVPVVGDSRPNASRYAARGLLSAYRDLARFPAGRFIVWAHHADSNRWLQAALAASGRPFVLVERSVPADRSALRPSRLTVPLKQFVARRARRVVLNAESQRDAFRAVFGISGAQLAVVAGSRPIAAIAERVRTLRADSTLRLRLGLPAGLLLVSVARLSSGKDPATLIRAVARLGGSAHLILVGDGEEEGTLRAVAAAEAPGRVTFAGRTDPLPYLAVADLFALATRFEGLPGALIEAMAASLPCVVSDVPGNRDLVTDGLTGLLVAPGAPDAFAAACARVVGNAALAAGLGAAAFAHVQANHDEAQERAAWPRLFAEAFA